MPSYDPLFVTVRLPNEHAFSFQAHLAMGEDGVVGVDHLEFPLSFHHRIPSSGGGDVNMLARQLIATLNGSRADVGDLDGGVSYRVDGGSLSTPVPAGNMSFKLSRPEHLLPGSPLFDSVLFVESRQLMESICLRFPAVNARPAMEVVDRAVLRSLEQSIACLAVQQAYQTHAAKLSEAPSEVMSTIKSHLSLLAPSDQQKAMTALSAARDYAGAVKQLIAAFPAPTPLLTPSPLNLQVPARYLTLEEAVKVQPWIRNDVNVTTEQGEVFLDGRKKPVSVTWVSDLTGEAREMAMATVDEGLDLVSVFQGDALRALCKDMHLPLSGITPETPQSTMRRTMR